MARETARRSAARRALREMRRRKAPSHGMVLRSHLRRAVDAAEPGPLPSALRGALRQRGLRQCARCGRVAAPRFFYSDARCSDCAMAAYARDPEGWFAERLARDAAQRAARAGVPCDIDAAWVRGAFAECARACALCGLEMRIERRASRGRRLLGDDERSGRHGSASAPFACFPMNASLDQREPAAGYTRANAQLVHVRCNISKLDMTQREFILMCHAVAARHPSCAEDNSV
jgi:hypothetical protein